MRQRVVAAVDPFRARAVLLLRVRDVVVLSSYMLKPSVVILALLSRRGRGLLRRSVLWVDRCDMLRLSSETFLPVGELRRIAAFGRRLVGCSHTPSLRLSVAFEGRLARSPVYPSRAILWISLRLISGIRNALALGLPVCARKRSRAVSSVVCGGSLLLFSKDLSLRPRRAFFERDGASAKCGDADILDSIPLISALFQFEPGSDAYAAALHCFWRRDISCAMPDNYSIRYSRRAEGLRCGRSPNLLIAARRTSRI